MLMIKMNNLRVRTEKDTTGPLSEGNKHLPFVSGKGRKKCLETDKKTDRDKSNPTLSAMLYHEKKRE